MEKVIDIFKEITALNRCSGNYDDFISYVKEFSSKYNYECFIDNYNNILCKKQDSKATLCIQNHYDIVCLIDNNIPKIIEKDGFFKAENSTLGADNGIGCSYMLSLMSQGYDCEFLFTSDEEIGLIGANNLEHKLNAKYMLNIDSEQEGEICIGCAGGVDIFGKTYNKQIIKNSDGYELYEVKISNLPGGHSGVNIHENRPNAIKLFAELVKENSGLLLDINAGERINSIPANVNAIVAFKSYPNNFNKDFVCINKIDSKTEHFNIWSNDILTFIYTFANGVRAYDEKLNVVLGSINLAKITTNFDSIDIELSARSMDNKNLETIKKETALLLESFGFEVKTSGKYPAWKPDVNEFTNEILKIYKTYDSSASLEAIHAGLECAIFKDKFPHMKLASIGPNIFNPHSNKESVEIKSIEKLEKIVKEIADNF